ncbi:MAG: oxidoreductase [Planctomycetota bacterium]|nr:MAG: oxidoreductase [Planctomycetota bacterium]
MRIWLTGASGFIGGHLLRALRGAGHLVTCLVRAGGEARLAVRDPGVRVVQAPFAEPAAWVHRLEGHDALVNAVGIIRERAGSRFAAVHTTAPIAAFEAAARLGVRVVVQISALGADRQARSRYHLSKRRADERLLGLPVRGVVLRPSLVYGRGDRSMELFATLARLPVVPVPGDGRTRLQPVWVGDLVRAVLVALERPGLAGVFDVGGGQVLALDALFAALGRWLGRRRTPRLHVPWPVLRLLAAATDALGGRGPITAEELQMLRRGNWCDNRPFVAGFGFAPVGFAEGLRYRPPPDTSLVRALARELRIMFAWG